MQKLLVVFGATGQQGRSVVDYVINDPDLSKQFTVRAITRDPTKPAAQALQQKGVEVVKADAEDAESVKQALQGAHTVFAMTDTTYEPQGKQKEHRLGKAMADAAVAAGAEYIIFSSLPHAGRLSGGQLNVWHFDVKAELEEYIRGLPIKSAFFAPGCFMQNFHATLAPHPTGDGTYAIGNIIKPTTLLPLIDIVGDAGKFVGAILAEPAKYEGKTISAATRFYSMDEIVQTMTKLTGKTIKYVELPEEVFRGYLPPQSANELVDMLKLFREHGYYGPKQNELVAWGAQQARGKLTTLEEFLTANPLRLA